MSSNYRFLPLAVFIVCIIGFAIALTKPMARKSDMGGYLNIEQFNPKPQQTAGIYHVFAPWCVECKKDLETFAKHNLKPYGIVFELEDEFDTKDYKPYYKAIIRPLKVSALLELGVTSVPETYVIDSAGEVLYRITGALARNDIEEVMKYAQRN